MFFLKRLASKFVLRKWEKNNCFDYVAIIPLCLGNFPKSFFCSSTVTISALGFLSSLLVVFFFFLLLFLELKRTFQHKVTHQTLQLKFSVCREQEYLEVLFSLFSTSEQIVNILTQSL